MKKKYMFRLLNLFLLTLVLLQACQKGKLYDTTTPKIVQITFSGSTLVPLEFIYNNQVLDSTKGTEHNFPANAIKLNITKGDQKVLIREKGKTAILKTYAIDPNIFDHKVNIFYNEGKIYDAGIVYKSLIWAADAGLDFYLDNQVIYRKPNAGLTIQPLTIPIDKGQKRELTVKRKGETKALLTKIVTDADSNKTLKFYLGGNDLVENLTIPALKDPKGMSLTFKLLLNPQSGEARFIGGDMDIIPYIRDMNTGEFRQLNPELRFTIPANQPFVTMELPPISDSEYYTFDFAKKGTNVPAFTSSKPEKEVKLGLGNYGFFAFPDPAIFLPGKRIICTLTIAEESAGNELFVMPAFGVYLTEFINFE